MHIFGNEATIKTITKDFDYAFAENKYRGVPVIELHTVSSEEPFSVAGVTVTAIEGSHSDRFRVLGFRIGALAYLTDFNDISNEERAKLEGVDTLVVNALRWERHSSHFSVNEALELIRQVKPRRAYLTHMSHEIGLYHKAQERLPEGVEFAYDGLEVEV